MSDDDGRHDFDFVPGVWQMHNRKLVNALDPECDEWVEFDSVSTGDIRLYGLGNTDRMLVESMPPDGQPYEGMTLRLFDPQEKVWRIWWTSSRYPGALDPPVVGRFEEDGVGRFYCDDVVNGIPVKVRFEWSDTTTDTPKWNQAFSFDDGRTWKPNWYNRFIRLSH
jgi:hypothetical protein